MASKAKTAESYSTLEITLKDQVATLRLFNIPQLVKIWEKEGRFTDTHWELGKALARLRDDDGVRVVVITGAEDGVAWLAPAVMDPSDFVLPEAAAGLMPDGIQVPDPLWKAFMGAIRTHQMIAEMEKPVVARVNGDVARFAQNIMFSCDIIVAREDARIVDHHVGLESAPYDMVPGDGGAALVPLYLSPARAKEYLMLAREYSGAELERLGAINYAVPMSRLDEVVDDIVARLLKRSAYALAMTKRVASRRVADHLNLTLDAAAAYEWVNILHFQGGGKDARTLE